MVSSALRARHDPSIACEFKGVAVTVGRSIAHSLPKRNGLKRREGGGGGRGGSKRRGAREDRRGMTNWKHVQREQELLDTVHRIRVLMEGEVKQKQVTAI